MANANLLIKKKTERLYALSNDVLYELSQLNVALICVKMLYADLARYEESSSLATVANTIEESAKDLSRVAKGLKEISNKILSSYEKENFEDVDSQTKLIWGECVRSYDSLNNLKIITFNMHISLSHIEGNLSAKAMSVASEQIRQIMEKISIDTGEIKDIAKEIGKLNNIEKVGCKNNILTS